MAPAAHQKTIMGSEVTILAERAPARCSHARKIVPLPMQTAAASKSIPSEGKSRCSQLLAGVKKAACSSATSESRLSSKDANLDSSRNTTERPF